MIGLDFNLIKRATNSFLRKFGLSLVFTKTLDSMIESRALHDYQITFLLASEESNLVEMIPLLDKSKSQNFQDLLVLRHLKLKRNGYFVEFGATNGIDFSNTYLLENEFAWSGILAEPARSYFKELSKNRPNAVLKELCVWESSDLFLPFKETSNRDLSTLNIFSESDHYSDERREGQIYEVQTISLIDLLDRNGAPSHIDYLSIDTEGSEFTILSAFDFDRYTFGVITCEHNYSPNREKIYELLTSKGYVRKFENLSKWDDWYFREVKG